MSKRYVLCHSGQLLLWYLALQVVGKLRTLLQKHIPLRSTEIRGLFPGQIVFLDGGTTNVALATDIRSESGQAEVLSLYLQQHGHGFVDPTEREMRRGLETSPEKLSKYTKNAKFAR